jgi:ATP-binding cassette subfamily C protein LapB
MKHLFDEMPRESVLVIVTHKLGILPRVDRIVVIDGGRIAADGPRDQILALMRKPAPGPHAASASASASTPVPSPVSAPRAAAPAPALSSPPAAA